MQATTDWQVFVASDATKMSSTTVSSGGLSASRYCIFSVRLSHWDYGYCFFFFAFARRVRNYSYGSLLLSLSLSLFFSSIHFVELRVVLQQEIVEAFFSLFFLSTVATHTRR